jgi:uncharacterized protein
VAGKDPFSMRSTIRAMAQRTEALVVILAAFGYFIFGAIYFVFHRSRAPHITERHLEFLLLYESLALGCLGTFLYLRGWTFRRLGLAPNVADTLIGVCLAVATYLAYVVVWIAFTAVNLPPTYLGGSGNLVAGDLTVATVVAASAVNAVFEEVFVCGYVITIAKEKGRPAFGVNASVAIRLAYHLYQGGVGVAGIVPFGLICGWWYARTGRLWPVVAAHAATDLTSLLQFAH